MTDIPPKHPDVYPAPSPDGTVGESLAAQVSDGQVHAIGGVAVAPHTEGSEGMVTRPVETATTLPDMMPEAEYREMLQEGYAPFASEAARIKEALRTTPPKEIPGYFAAGNESNIFMVEHGGKKYALRVSKQEGDEAAQHIDSYVRACRRGQGIPGMEQLAGLSYEGGVTAAELFEARGIDKYSSEEIAAIPEEHWRDLARTLVMAARRGVSIDGNDGNLLHGPEAGFGIVDYGDNDDPTSSRGIAQPVTGAAFMNTYWLPQGELPASEHPEDYAVLASVLEDISPVYDRWIQILAEVEQEQGVGQGFLLRLDGLVETSEHIKQAQQALGEEGAIETLTAAAKEKRLAAVEKLKARSSEEENDFIKENLIQRAAKLAQEPGLIFPKGKVKVSRNDKR